MKRRVWATARAAISGGAQRVDRSRWRLCALVLLMSWFATGCLTTRNFKDPKERPVRGTAYTLGARRVQPTVGLFGQQIDDLGASAAVDVGIRKRGQIGVNVAHGALGVINVRGKANIIDKNGWGLGFDAAFVWVNPQAIWILDKEEYRDPLGDLRIFTIPIRVRGSFSKWDYFGFDLGLGYTHAELFGDIDEESVLFDGSIGARKVTLEPRVSFYLVNRLHLFVGGELQLYGAARVENVTQQEIEDGLQVGVRTAGWQGLDFKQGSHGIVGVTGRFGKYTYITLSAIINGALSRSDVVGVQFIPAIAFSWRI